MFAKRRANAHKWTVESSPLPPVQVSKPVIPITRRSTDPHYDNATATRELGRAAMSPWDAAAQFGHVEPAFQHLKHAAPPSVPRPPTSPPQPSKLSGASTHVLSPARDLVTSPVNGTYYINNGESHVTSPGYHQLLQQRSDTSSPWQRDVSETPSSVDAGYRPIHFSVQLPIDFVDH